LPIVWDEGENAKVSSASIAKWLERVLIQRSRPLSAIRMATPRPRRERRQESRGGIQLSYQNHARWSR